MIINQLFLLILTQILMNMIIILLIYNILKEINVSIPKIIEKNDSNLTIISEDFGDLRFDKIFK